MHDPRLLAFALLWCAAARALLLAAPYDLVVRGGRLIDGSGNAAYFADVAIQNGRIVAVGAQLGVGQREIDARGLVVAPGFIDVHTHGEDIRELPEGANYARMGVTTIVLGNCGSSVKDVAALWAHLAAQPASLNVATLVGHNTLRVAAMGGSFDRAPTAAEMARMQSAVERAMQDGAMGLSTGLIYLPGTFAQTDEIIALAKVAAAYDGIYTSHMRDEGTQILSALQELFAVARGAGIRAQISHLKLSGPKAWGRHAEILAAIERARAEGLDITQDQYAYTASSTGLSQLIGAEAREGRREDFVARLADPAQKAAIVQEMKDRLHRAGRENYGYAVIAHFRPDPTLNGKSVVEAARLKYGADALDAQIELVLDIHRQGGASAIFHGMSEPDLQAFLAHPNTMVAADGGVRRLGEGVPHPRSYGNNARVLARYVRELKILRLEDAVRRMTSAPATVFRLKDRGTIREGAWADLVVFDPATVADPATYADPHHYATGFRAVLVNGVPVVERDAHTGATPGQPVRPGK